MGNIRNKWKNCKKTVGKSKSQNEEKWGNNGKTEDTRLEKVRPPLPPLPSLMGINNDGKNEDDYDDEPDKIPTHHLVFCLLGFCPLGFILQTTIIPEIPIFRSSHHH